ncbi:helix-turn-helix domain-containing protein [Methylobacterium sp. WL9]|uniref:XRE family transcriptional regulator n=1 Tax=Methylobacterium sp. WL9 TaxID=2603898 RepID=UPI00164F97FD|nr:helix-turn-helix domain-containing protein [Methylobacterium sp. WL9]
MTWHDLIREARNSRGWSQARLGKAVGVSQAAIAKIEKSNPKSTVVLDALIEALELDRSLFPTEAFGQEREGGPMVVQPVPEFARDPAYWAAAAGLVGDVPLYAAAEGGEGSLIIERDPIGAVKRPPLLQGVKNGYAIYLTGTSMSPEFEPGDTLFVNPRLPVLRDASCVFYGADDDEPKASVKRYLSHTEVDWTVRQFSPDKTFTMAREQWPLRHRIVSKNFR